MLEFKVKYVLHIERNKSEFPCNNLPWLVLGIWRLLEILLNQMAAEYSSGNLKLSNHAYLAWFMIRIFVKSSEESVSVTWWWSDVHYHVKLIRYSRKGFAFSPSSFCNLWLQDSKQFSRTAKSWKVSCLMGNHKKFFNLKTANQIQMVSQFVKCNFLSDYSWTLMSTLTTNCICSDASPFRSNGLRNLVQECTSFQTGGG